jgi:hypothetical protein
MTEDVDSDGRQDLLYNNATVVDERWGFSSSLFSSTSVALRPYELT